MRLRYLILLTAAAGGVTALGLALNFYWQLSLAEQNFLLHGRAVGPEFFRQFGVAHAAGLLALAFMFFALFLLLLTGSREVKTPAGKSPAPVLPPAPAATPESSPTRSASVETTPLAPPAQNPPEHAENGDTTGTMPPQQD